MVPDRDAAVVPLDAPGRAKGSGCSVASCRCLCSSRLVYMHSGEAQAAWPSAAGPAVAYSARSTEMQLPWKREIAPVG